MRIVDFRAHGPFGILTTKMKAGGKIVSRENGLEFWEHHSDYGNLNGCYIYVIAYGKKCVPWYVGKTTRGFENEVFSGRNLNKYNVAIAKHKRCTPRLFLIACAGRTNKRAIHETETFLIRECKKVNPHLLNRTNVKPRRWEIDGVTKRGQRRPTSSSTSLKRMLGL